MSKPVNPNGESVYIQPQLRKMYENLQPVKEGSVWGHIIRRLDSAREKIYNLGKEGLMSRPQRTLMKLEGHIKYINAIYKEHEEKLAKLELEKNNAPSDRQRKLIENKIKEHNALFNVAYKTFDDQLEVMQAIYYNAKAKILNKDELLLSNQDIVGPKTKKEQTVKNVHTELKAMMEAHEKEKIRAEALEDQEKLLSKEKKSQEEIPQEEVPINEGDNLESLLTDLGALNAQPKTQEIKKAAPKGQEVKKEPFSNLKYKERVLANPKIKEKEPTVQAAYKKAKADAEELKAKAKALNEIKESLSTELENLLNGVNTFHKGMIDLPNWTPIARAVRTIIKAINDPKTNPADLRGLVDSGCKNLEKLMTVLNNSQRVGFELELDRYEIDKSLTKLNKLGY